MKILNLDSINLLASKCHKSAYCNLISDNQMLFNKKTKSNLQQFDTIYLGEAHSYTQNSIDFFLKDFKFQIFNFKLSEQCVSKFSIIFAIFYHNLA